MKKFITILLTLIAFNSYSQSHDVTLIHFNYTWNEKNDYKNLSLIKRANISKAFVEDQNADLQASIKSVPTIIIFRDGKQVAKLEAGISMKINATIEEIQELVDINL